jgi:alkylation response protein AidB-like acyl-CoA dehydrogenase
MDFRFTDDQLTLAQGVRDFLAGTHGADVLRRLDAAAGAGGTPRDPAIWQGLVDMGLPALLVPEAQGGLELGLVEAALIATECGRVCLAEPLVETAFVAVPWLRKHGRCDDLEAIAAGKRLPGPAHLINGWVSDGAGVPLQSVDPLRCLSIADKTLSDDPDLLDLGALMAAAQLVGMSDAMLAQATEYAKVRTQFGQPIGAFQAIKHQLASVAVAVEFAKPVVWRAAAALQDNLASAPLHVSHA